MLCTQLERELVEAIEYVNGLKSTIMRLESERLEAKAELILAQVTASAMRKALSLVVPTCESLHHPAAYRHTATMPCKACDVVRKAMAL